MAGERGDRARAGRRAETVVRMAGGAVLGIVLGALVLRGADVRAIGAVLGRAAPAPLILALVALGGDFLLRTIRFRALLAVTAGRRLPLGSCVGPFVAGFGLNDLVPLRAGDGLRVLWFSRGFSLPVATVLGTMLIERVLDLGAVLTIGIVALAARGSALLAATGSLIAVAAIVAGAGAVALRRRWRVRGAPPVRSPRLAALLKRAAGLADGLAAIESPRRAARFAALSLACWGIESLVFLCAWVSLGARGPIAAPFLAFAFAVLGAALPGLPGQFGSFEYLSMQAFAGTGVGTAYATAVVFLAHLLLWAPIALFAIGWLMLRIGRAPARRLREGASPA